jgi:hypothetical protein
MKTTRKNAESRWNFRRWPAQPDLDRKRFAEFVRIHGKRTKSEVSQRRIPSAAVTEFVRIQSSLASQVRE